MGKNLVVIRGKVKKYKRKKYKSVFSSVEFVKVGGCIVGNCFREVRNG